MSDVPVIDAPVDVNGLTEVQPVFTPAVYSSASLVLDSSAMDKMTRIADLMANGRTTIPKHLQGSQGDCFAVCMQALQWGMNPFAVAQKTHIVNGSLGYEAQLVIAVLNASQALVTRLNWRWSDTWGGVNGKADKSDDHWVDVWATLKGEAAPRLLHVAMSQVGDVRTSPLWAADPRQQLAYLAAKRWGRLHAPDAILGVYTPDELQDGADAGTIGNDRLPPNATPAQIAQHAAPKAERTAKHNKLIDEFEKLAKEGGFEAFKARWAALSKEDRTAIGTAERDRIGEIGHESDRRIAEHPPTGA